MRAVPVAACASEPVEWLWPGWLPLGMLVVMDGDPGVGKSTLALDLASRVSLGHAMPFERLLEDRPRRSVLLLSAEDGVANTIRPRLEASGADLSRIFTLEDSVEGWSGPSEPMTLPEGVAKIERVVREKNISLVIIDVLMAYLGGKVDSYRDADVRRALRPLQQMAERHHVTVLVLRHLSKSGGANAIYRGGGSIGIIGAARVGLLVARDPMDPTGEGCVLAQVKNNLAKMPKSLGFRLEGHPDLPCARVRWTGEVTSNANDLLAASDAGGSGRLGEAKEQLLAMLADGKGAVRVVEAKRRAGELGISVRSLERAKQELGLRSVKDSFGGFGTWALPDAASPAVSPDLARLASDGGIEAERSDIEALLREMGEDDMP